MSQTRTIRWIVDHEPVELFIRTARAFDQKIRELTQDSVQVEIYTSEEYSKKFSTAKVHPLTMINAGDAEVTQVETRWVGSWYNPDFFALELPYLFKDHAHATRVLDGAIGKKLLSKVQETSAVRGLAFTYSGGFRVFASDQEVKTSEDFVKLTCVSTLNPVRVDTARALGCTVIPATAAMSDDRNNLVKAKGTVETTLPRYDAEAYRQGLTHIARTDHSMFLTTILINNDFFNSLTPEQQQAMTQASAHVAKLERSWTVSEADQIEADTESHERKGISYHRFAEAEIAKLKQKVQPLYDKYRDIFSPQLVDDMIKA